MPSSYSKYSSPHTDRKPVSLPYEFEAAAFETSITMRFESIVRHHPQRIAIHGENLQLSYHDLNEIANRLAHCLLSYNISPQQRTAVLTDFGTHSVTAFLGVIKAGQICLTLDNFSPDAYLKNLLEDAETQIIITDDKHVDRANQLALRENSILNMDQLDPKLCRSNPHLQQSPDDPVVILYTSGSTGRAKGVVQNHRNLLRSTLGYINAYQVNANDRTVLLASCSGAQGLVTALTPLLSGAAVYPYNIRQKGINQLADWLLIKGITLYISSPSVFRHFVQTLHGDENFAQLRLIRLGSEILYTQDIENFRAVWPDQCVIIHAYSSTESGNITLNFLHKHTALSGDIVNAGFSVPGMEVLLYDKSGQPAAADQCGEIMVRSRYLSPGYWRWDKLNENIFPAGLQQGKIRVYRTGDLGRWRADGSLEHLGRKDFRVKIRGYRIELGEIESALTRHPSVQAAVVVVHAAGKDSKSIVAYVTTKDKGNTGNAPLRRYLSDRIPHFMLPSVIIQLENFPLTANGKVDRNALSDPDLIGKKEAVKGGLQSATGRHLAAIWCDLFTLEHVDGDADFFALGGHSLLVAELRHTISAVFDKQITAETIFEYPTLRELAQVLDKPNIAKQSHDANIITAIRATGSQAPLFWLNGAKAIPLLRDQLNSDRPLYLLNHQALDGKPARHTTIPAIAAHYLRAIRKIDSQGPYYLGGYSIGGLIAYEIARQLTGQGKQVALLFLLGPAGLSACKITKPSPLLRYAGLRTEINRLKQLGYLTYWRSAIKPIISRCEEKKLT